MSLSSLLLGSVKAVDSELDSLFKATPATRPRPPPAPVAESSKDAVKKRKLDSEKKTVDTPPTKRAKSSPEKTTEKKAKKVKTDNTPAKTAAPKVKKTDKGKAKDIQESESDEDNNSDLENAYLHGKKETAPQPPSADSDEESDEGDLSELVHESLKSKSKKTPRSKQKFVPENETTELRDQRTIFVGNLPIDIAQKKSLLKQLQRHILSFVPTAKIESTRFRSIPFQAPTAKLPTSDDEGDASKSKPKSAPEKQPRQHVRDRMSAWRLHSKYDEDEEEVNKDNKKFLNPNQKKKIAFINQEFHSTADTINAYVVFLHAVPAENRPANLPPLPPSMDPYDAARLAIEKADGTLFMERMIRVDRVGKKGAAVAADKDAGVVGTDVKLSVFVGNLDFATKEEDLRVFFEGVVSTERGPPPEGDDEDDEDAQVKKPNMWVTRVRIVRDKDTQLGKGFAYVQFTDRECVDEVLALEQDKLKFAKRKLRVQRCKTLPGSVSSAAPKRGAASDGRGPAGAKGPRGPQIIVPKGDPALGERLANLSKDERKQAKATDADRVARRLAKKKARMAMGTAVKSKTKDRERVRKPTVDKTKGTNPGKKESKKGRVRSDKSLAKRNAKKA